MIAFSGPAVFCVIELVVVLCVDHWDVTGNHAGVRCCYSGGIPGFVAI